MQNLKASQAGSAQLQYCICSHASGFKGASVLPVAIGFSPRLQFWSLRCIRCEGGGLVGHSGPAAVSSAECGRAPVWFDDGHWDTLAPLGWPAHCVLETPCLSQWVSTREGRMTSPVTSLGFKKRTQRLDVIQSISEPLTV